MVDVDSLHASLDAIESFFVLLPGEFEFTAFHLTIHNRIFFSHGALPSEFVLGSPEGSLQPQSFNCGSRKPSGLESAGISGEVKSMLYFPLYVNYRSNAKTASRNVSPSRSIRSEIESHPFLPSLGLHPPKQIRKLFLTDAEGSMSS